MDTKPILTDIVPGDVLCVQQPSSSVEICGDLISLCGDLKLVPRFIDGRGIHNMSDLHNLMLCCKVNQYFTMHGNGRVLIYVKLKGWFWQRRKQLEIINGRISEIRIASIYMQAFLQPHWTVALAKTLWLKIRYRKKVLVGETQEG